MYSFNYLQLLGLLTLILFSSCSREDEKFENPLLKQIDSYGIVTEDGIDVDFDTQLELLNYLKKTDLLKFKEAVDKFEFLNHELDMIYKLGLVDREDDDPVVIEYLEKYKIEDVPKKNGTLNFCHHGYGSVGPTVWTPYVNPRINNNNRNKYSSVTAVSSTVLCTKRWFLGSHKFYWGTVNLSYPMDNNSESYY